jgi:hypothetical protein
VPAEFRPDRILGTLEKHGVEFVLIGGLAATAHGSPMVTRDVDITPARGPKNLERLSSALKELHARMRTESEPDGLEFDHGALLLSRLEILNLVTDAGDLDLSLSPSGTRGFEDLTRDAVRMEILGVSTRVASLADVVRSKEAAGRMKDLAALPTLRRLLERQEEKDT